MRLGGEQHLPPGIPRQCLTADFSLIVALIPSACSTVRKSNTLIPEAGDSGIRLQIFLDGKGLGPGVADGRNGEFTRKALYLYRQSRGLPPSFEPDTRYIRPYTVYTVTDSDAGALGAMAESPQELAKQEKLPYIRLSEFIGERFHTTEVFLQELNPGVALNRILAGTVLRVPNVRRSFSFKQFPSGYPAALESSGGERRVVVDTALRMLRVLDADRLIAAFPITSGSTEHPAPLDSWRVVGRFYRLGIDMMKAC
ncbi:MAG: peptidoglycan-binding protein [Verrucomicrobiales bacterium]|nr:peptidoglycan-binding protein [Verrucomicrobiales bacterium]